MNLSETFLVKHRCDEVFFKLVASAVLIGASIWSNNEVHANEKLRKEEDQLERIRKVARSWLLIEDNYSLYSTKTKEPPKKGRDLIEYYRDLIFFACW